MYSMLLQKNAILENPYIYTISDRNTKPFTLQINKKPNKNITKTTMVSFRNEIDAFTMAYLLENHKKIQHDWPYSIFDGENQDSSFSIYGDMRNINNNVKLIELNIESWKDEELQKYCVKNIMDILYIDNLDKHKNNKFSLQGKLYNIEADFQYYIDIFNDKLR